MRKVVYIAWKAKNYFRKGGGEIIGFMATMPIIAVIILLVIAVSQNALIHENLEYTAYTACRAAVIREEYDDALLAAQKVAEESMVSANASYEGIPVVTLSVIDGNSKKAEWKKGNYVKCEVAVTVKEPTGRISEKKAHIVMMIERPAEDGNEFLL